jgi:hypothetical protein
MRVTFVRASSSPVARNGVVTFTHATLEQQFFDVAQAELEAKVPANGVADDRRRESMSVIERFRSSAMKRFVGGPRNLALVSRIASGLRGAAGRAPASHIPHRSRRARSGVFVLFAHFLAVLGKIAFRSTSWKSAKSQSL